MYIVDVCENESTFVPIQCDTRTWTTVFVEWFHDMEHHEENSRGYYVILDTNGKEISKGDFTCCRTVKAATSLYGVSIGGRFNRTHTLTGAISAVEVYISENVDDARSLPSKLRRLITDDQKMTPS